MAYVIPHPDIGDNRDRSVLVYTIIIFAATAIGGGLLIWYISTHATPGGLALIGIVLAAILASVACSLRRQRRILNQLNRLDRQMAHVRMTYVAEEIAPGIDDLE